MWERVSKRRCSSKNEDWSAVPYCNCWDRRTPVSWNQLNGCTCGEDTDVSEWKWQYPDLSASSSVIVSDCQKLVTFHPSYSSGTAVVRGDTELQHGQHYYWEVKMLTETYGTDIMIGIGTDKVNLTDSQYKFTSLLGEDSESYGLSYRGSVRHDSLVAQDSAGFCRGSIVGVRLDMWQGTLEFYLNRKPQGLAFHNLRRHPLLYPMVCSTAAQSSLRLIYATSWRASLLVDAARTLAASVRRDARMKLPPGLWRILKTEFWLTLPGEGCIEEEAAVEQRMELDPEQPELPKSLLTDILPSQYINGYYVDHIERDYRVVVFE